MNRPTLDQPPTFAVLLLHGLYAQADELKAIAAALHKRFGKAVLIIQPTCRVRFKSVIRPIAQQAADLLRHIALNLMHYNQDLQSFPLIIIGYSQGGVLACTLGQSYKNQLNIVGIITLNAPLMGTPLLERSCSDVQAFISHAKTGLQLIDYPLFRMKWSMTLQAWMRLLTRPGWMPLHGLKDIFPNSPCIKEVCSFLEVNREIPCLLIATHQNDFSALFHIKTVGQHKKIEALNDAYALLITGQKGGRHDTLIPLASQLASEDCLNTLMLTDIKNSSHDYAPITWPHRPQVKGRMYKGILHASNLIAIDPNLFVDQCETVLYADLVLSDIIQFIEQSVQSAGASLLY